MGVVANMHEDKDESQITHKANKNQQEETKTQVFIYTVWTKETKWDTGETNQ